MASQPVSAAIRRGTGKGALALADFTLHLHAPQRLLGRQLFDGYGAQANAAHREVALAVGEASRSDWNRAYKPSAVALSSPMAFGEGGAGLAAIRDYGLW